MPLFPHLKDIMHPRLCRPALPPALCTFRNSVWQPIHVPIWILIPPVRMSLTGTRSGRLALPVHSLLLLKVLGQLVQQKVEELVSVLVHVAPEQLVLFLQPLDKTLGRNHARLLFLGADLQGDGPDIFVPSSLLMHSFGTIESPQELPVLSCSMYFQQLCRKCLTPGLFKRPGDKKKIA
jgi:hypothetical protein